VQPTALAVSGLAWSGRNSIDGTSSSPCATGWSRVSLRATQRRIDKTGDSDPVSQDQLIAAAEKIQEQSWWFQAMDA